MRRLLPLALLALAACEPPPDVEPLACRDPDPGVVELGVGDLATGFVPLEDGQEIAVVLGPQGMHMIVVSARVEDLEQAEAGGSPTELRVALRYDGAVVGGTWNRMEPSFVLGNVSEFLGVRAVITEAEVEDLVGELVDVEVTVHDGCGRDLFDAKQWVFVQ